jgi:hypothetical protein
VTNAATFRTIGAAPVVLAQTAGTSGPWNASLRRLLRRGGRLRCAALRGTIIRRATRAIAPSLTIHLVSRCWRCHKPGGDHAASECKNYEQGKSSHNRHLLLQYAFSTSRHVEMYVVRATYPRPTLPASLSSGQSPANVNRRPFELLCTERCTQLCALLSVVTVSGILLIPLGAGLNPSPPGQGIVCPAAHLVGVGSDPMQPLTQLSKPHARPEAMAASRRTRNLRGIRSVEFFSRGRRPCSEPPCC